MPHRPYPLMALLLSAWLALAGCGERRSDDDAGEGPQLVGARVAGDPAEAPPPGVGAVLRFISPEDHNFLDPQRMTWLHDIRVAECLFETLVRTRVPELTMEPAAAERWEVGEDGLTYTFHLRPEARWSNGDPLTAHDFVFAWRRMALPDFAADYSQLFFRIAGVEELFAWRRERLAAYAAGPRTVPAARALWEQTQQRFEQTVGIKALDAGTLEVRLAQPTPYFLDLVGFISFAPLHEKSVAATTGIDASTGMLQQDATYWSDPERLVSNGPYRLASRRPGRDLRMVQNGHYWNRAAMRNPAITELIVKGTQAQLLRYRRGEADWLPDVPTAEPIAADLLAERRAGRRRDVHATPWAGTYFYNFNCLPELPDGRKNPLADARVRRALAMAFNRETIVAQVTRLNQPTARSFIPPGALDGYDPPVEAGADFDPAAARSLLAEAGYAGGASLRGLSILYNTDAGHEHVAQQIRRDWQENLGLTVTLEGLNQQAFKDRLKHHNFTIARAGWIGDYPDPTTFLDKMISDNGNNDAAYNNPRFDALMRQAAGQRDAAQRLATLRQAEALMLADQPIAPIFHYVTIQLYDPDKVHDLHPNQWVQRRLEFVYVRP